MCRPVIIDKCRRTLFSSASWVGQACKMTSVSSAYYRTGQVRSCHKGWRRRFSREADCIMGCKKSAARMNRYDDKGSACRSPFLHWNHLPGTSLSITTVWLEGLIQRIHRRHLGEKPLASRMSSRASQLIESKALRKSSLRMRSPSSPTHHEVSRVSLLLRIRNSRSPAPALQACPTYLGGDWGSGHSKPCITQ